jgi:hypothetical protein
MVKPFSVHVIITDVSDQKNILVLHTIFREEHIPLCMLAMAEHGIIERMTAGEAVEISGCFIMNFVGESVCNRVNEFLYIMLGERECT